MGAGLRVVEIPERPVCVVVHPGPVETVDETRRPLYRHMIQHELVGGPSIIRFPAGRPGVDAMVVTHLGFEGDEVCKVEHLAAGRYAVADFEGHTDALALARQRFTEAVGREHGRATGAILQVHLMDPIDDIVEEQFQAYLG